MDDDELKGILRRAYLPYAKGFLLEPTVAKLATEIEDEYVDAYLRLGDDDFDVFDETVQLRALHRRAWAGLIGHLDEDRVPNLYFERLSDGETI